MIRKLVILLFAMFCAVATSSASSPEGTGHLHSGYYEYVSIEDSPANVEIVFYHGGETHVSVPDTLDGFSVTRIGDSSFRENPTLESISLPPGVTSIGTQAFAQCASLSELNLNEGLTNIGDYAFNRCGSLSQASIPDTVSTVGRGAFSYSPSLESVWIGQGVESFSGNPFVGCTALQTIGVPPGHPGFSVRDGVLFTQDGQQLIAYPCGLTAKEYNVPEGTKAIGEDAFSRSGLVQVNIPGSVSVLYQSAFAQSPNLSVIYLPEGISSISDGLFSGCTSLQSLQIPSGVRSIGKAAFAETGLTSLTLPDGLTDIGEYTFFNCAGLGSVFVPGSVVSIGAEAFTASPTAFVVVEGSAAEDYCIKNKIPYHYTYDSIRDK